MCGNSISPKNRNSIYFSRRLRSRPSRVSNTVWFENIMDSISFCPIIIYKNERSLFNLYLNQMISHIHHYHGICKYITCKYVTQNLYSFRAVQYWIQYDNHNAVHWNLKNINYCHQVNYHIHHHIPYTSLSTDISGQTALHYTCQYNHIKDYLIYPRFINK